MNYDRLAKVVRRHVLRTHRKDSCIASTRVVIEVLWYYGVPSVAMPTRAAAWNAEGWELAKAHVPIEDWPQSAHSVGVAATGEHRPGRWDGHLVAVVGLPGQPRTLIDASLDQLSRPERGIVLEATAFTCPADWKGEALTWTDNHGVVMLYEQVSDLAYKRSSNWSRKHPVNVRITAAVIRELGQEAL